MHCKILLIAAVSLFGLGMAFQPVATTRFTIKTEPTTTTTSLRFNPFKGFVDGMESGYSGGEDSEFSKRKGMDQEKRANERAKNEEKKARGFTLLKDVSDKTFVETKYKQEEKDDAVDKWAKGMKGKAFKFPWD